MDHVPTRNPSNVQLAQGVNRLIDWAKEHAEDDKQAFEDLHNDIKIVKDKILKDTQRRKFFRTVAASLSSMGGVVIIWKVLAVAIPALAVAFAALNHAIITGRVG